MANVIFKVGTRAQYDLIDVKDQNFYNTLYWLTDTQELWKGDILFGVGTAATEKAAGLLSAEDKTKLDALVESGVLNLTPVDGSVVIDKNADGMTIGVGISKELGNAIVLKDDGLYVSPYDGGEVPELTLNAGNGIEFDGGSVSIKLDEEEANGLKTTGNGLGLGLATIEAAGAMSAIDKKFLSSIPALYDEVRYDFFSLPNGACVNHQGKEYRIMFPTDTNWVKQNGGSGSSNYDPDSYYFAMRAYAPSDSVVAFKEDTADAIKDTTLYHFDDAFAGTDEYGRKYSVVWLPAARYDSASSTWTYHGSKSGDGKYVGWYYSVEWYDEDNNVVASDTIRINLSNEGCHNSLTPFYMNNYATHEDIKEIRSGFEWDEM